MANWDKFLLNYFELEILVHPGLMMLSSAEVFFCYFLNLYFHFSCSDFFFVNSNYLDIKSFFFLSVNVHPFWTLRQLAKFNFYITNILISISLSLHCFQHEFVWGVLFLAILSVLVLLCLMTPISSLLFCCHLILRALYSF